MKATVRVLRIATAGLLLLVAWGCADSGGDVDTTPFEEAIHSYLAANSMDLKVHRFKNLQVNGESAQGTVSLEHAEGMVGAKVQWQFWFEKRGDEWRVTRHQS